jgi:tRNA(Ile)-lysidine synthase
MKHPCDFDWLAASTSLGAVLPPARWPERLCVWLATESRVTEPWCVALSGGADSVALLLTLSGMRLAEGETDEDRAALHATGLVALHFNHRLRGAAADADEQFCRELCAALGVRLIVDTANWPVGREVSEAEAREARFSFFGDAMAELGARMLWLGHHRDDVVETMLLRLSRGSGSRGLAAPRPVQRMADGSVRLRPLLGVPKTEIVAALRAAGVPWCEDETNHGDAYFRNRLRRQVVPAWAAANRVASEPDQLPPLQRSAESVHDREDFRRQSNNLGEAVARSRALLEEEDEALELWADRVLPAVLGAELPLAPLRDAPVAVARRALHRWLVALKLGDGLGRVAFADLLAAVRAGREAKLSVGEAGFLSVGGEVLRLVAAATVVPDWPGGALPVPGEIVLPDGAKLRAVSALLDAEVRRRILTGEFDDGRTAFLAARETSAALSIRRWRPGDRYQPLGAAQATKLQDQFVNRRIPRELRQRLPVVCAADGAILWVPGLPPAHNARLVEGTMVALQLTYLPVDSLSATRHV